MGASEKPTGRCGWCRKEMPQWAEACPHCGRPAMTEELRPLEGGPETREEGVADPWGQEAARPERGREEAAARVRGMPPTLPPARDERYEVKPLPPAEGQQHQPGSWEYVKAIARADRLFGVVVVVLAIEVVGALIGGGIFSVVIAGLGLWGVLTLTWWGYLIAMVGAGLNLLWFTGLLMGAQRTGDILSAGGLCALALWGINLFVLLVLYTRREHFA